MELNKESSVWDFVEKYYPNYSSSDEIAHNEDLSKLINGEVNGDAEVMLNDEYGGDINNPQIGIDFDRSEVNILRDSIEGYLESLGEQHTSYRLVTGFLGDVPGMFDSISFSTPEAAREFFIKEYRNRNKGDGSDEYWNNKPLVIQRVTTETKFVVDER